MVLVFQSLIGKLQTKGGVKEMRKVIKFQSLIGKLQTESTLGNTAPYARFQSLIGKLQTRLIGFLKSCSTQVSIPHR